MDIKALREQYGDYAIARRRYYHAHPELPEQEKETCESIRRDLLEMGITDIRMMETCHGLVATIHGGKSGKTVALRTDIDALPVQEATGLSFASVNPGVMHACGHDAHIAMLLGAAKILNACKDELQGDVRLVVQPSEELASGAAAMVREGALDGVDAIYGHHVMGDLDAPFFSVGHGPRMAGAAFFTIDVEGFAAHGSTPHDGKDAITTAAAIINNLQQCVSRLNDPKKPLVLTIGTIESGGRFNIIPNHVHMEGTVRTFDEGTKVEEHMRRIIECTAEAFDMKATLDFRWLTRVVTHKDEKLIALAENAAQKLYGPDILKEIPPMMGSEDFSEYGAKVPYVYCIHGIRDEAKGHIYSNHHEKFNYDEDCISRGAAIMAQFAVDFLMQKDV